MSNGAQRENDEVRFLFLSNIYIDVNKLVYSLIETRLLVVFELNFDLLLSLVSSCRKKIKL